MTAPSRRPVARVEEPGPFTTIQDFGRFGYRRFGVPSSGALDLWSLSYANNRLGNEPDAPALEVFQGPFVAAALEDALVGHSGRTAELFVDGVATRDNPVRVAKGSRLKLSSGSEAVVYAAFRGGLLADSVMGSASTYTRAKFGGLSGRTLAVGDVLRSAASPSRGVARGAASLETSRHLRIVRGPQAELFPPEGLELFFAAHFRVSFDSDRMGYRLEGPPLTGFNEWGKVLTFPVFPGMVQITPDGLPIVLMADCQTTGGYPVIGVLTPPDLGALARKTPGTEVSFQEISEAESERIARSFSDSVGLRIRGGR